MVEVTVEVTVKVTVKVKVEVTVKVTVKVKVEVMVEVTVEVTVKVTVQVHLFNHLSLSLNAHLQGQRNRFQDRREISRLSKNFPKGPETSQCNFKGYAPKLYGWLCHHATRVFGPLDAERPPAEQEGGGQEGHRLRHLVPGGHVHVPVRLQLEQDERVDDDDDQGGEEKDKDGRAPDPKGAFIRK